jgi:hypothetical protein
MGRVGRRLTDAIEAATGERIVAFGRVGKPPENPFLRAFFPAAWRARETSENSLYSATAF